MRIDDLLDAVRNLSPDDIELVIDFIAYIKVREGYAVSAETALVLDMLAADPVRLARLGEAIEDFQIHGGRSDGRPLAEVLADIRARAWLMSDA